LFGAFARLVLSPQLGLLVARLALGGLLPLLVALQGGVGLGVEVRVALLEVLGAPSLELLLQTDPPVV
jgi:hypothetical protein